MSSSPPPLEDNDETTAIKAIVANMNAKASPLFLTTLTTLPAPPPSTQKYIPPLPGFVIVLMNPYMEEYFEILKSVFREFIDDDDVSSSDDCPQFENGTLSSGHECTHSVAIEAGRLLSSKHPNHEFMLEFGASKYGAPVRHYFKSGKQILIQRQVLSWGNLERCV
jgi:hypothetical protein